MIATVVAGNIRGVLRVNQEAGSAAVSILHLLGGTIRRDRRKPRHRSNQMSISQRRWFIVQVDGCAPALLRCLDNLSWPLCHRPARLFYEKDRMDPSNPQQP